MAIKERYRDNIFYVYKPSKRAVGTVIEWNEQPFTIRGNYVTIKKQGNNPVGDVHMGSVSTVIKTDTQKEIPQFSRITVEKIPINKANRQDFSIVENVDKIPIKQKGNRYRTREYYSRTITIS